MNRSSRYLLLTGLCVCALVGAMQSDVGAQGSVKPLTTADQDDLDQLSAQRRAEERKSDLTRQTARQIAIEIEELRQQIIDISQKQGVGETRAAIYRAKLETLNLQEADITRQLTAQRARESRLLSALQIYSRNPPPAILVEPRKANDAVIAAIIMRAITPELQKRTDVLVQQNAQLVNLRRQAALQNEALIITEGDVSDQRRQIETLIEQKMTLEDQLLGQADQMDANAVALKAREDRMRGASPLKGLFALGKSDDTTHLGEPVVGNKVRAYGVDGARGVYYQAQPGAQVVSPGEGEVEFVGPLDSYGQVIILNLGQNYRVVLTGLGRVYVDKGQTVARGEPVARLPNLSADKAALYMELRHGDDPVNPGMAVALK